MKNSKRIKGFAVGCLAVLMCGTALLGVGCTPATSGAQGTNPTSSANGGGNLSTNNSPFGLDPANDPVVYTTESGLEIKCSNALTNTNLASYTYLTMGSYNGTPVNWVIIGYDPSVSNLVGEFSGKADDVDPIQGGHSFDSTVDDSPMGNAIKKEMYAISSEAKPNEEIGDGCVLCLSEYALLHSVFGDSNIYSSSTLLTNMRNLYYPATNNNDLNFSYLETSLIASKTLTTSGSSSLTEFLFPLGSISYNANESFAFQNYLDDETGNIGEMWWLRSKTTTTRLACNVYVDGRLNLTNDIGNPLGVRPAFVMKLG